ncbi:DNA segregation ATPase, FtsK/SpoIIIE family [Desulfosporosinus acidiphilus SJ4]|uniref:DNA segregation ATPase, FtsK/SpoIIIE family n=1 Tax=Desulfosporosinus acidiphilus (strain DSM 22704 / JCM 16185 / SJ4) TaxID=646529 RepID=I4DC76_DESAJ|nr:FtsK/SpoIIIE domain-containing protein [Desulfosporosinus acidiphilus]AFM43400.1 DNA segregation ATPase, FtsK/SpoIIIE family [Desulfosporosinus acidiphilus SJ4]
MNMYEQLVMLASRNEDYEIPIQHGVVWSLRASPHALISANTGFGKSFFTLYLIIMASIKNAILFLADPKNSDLGSLSSFMPHDRVAWEPERIVAMVHNVVDVMMERYGYMQAERLQRGLFQADFADFGLPIIFLVIEEMAAFVLSLGKSKRESFEADVKSITLQGRQAGVMLCSIMQNPGSQNISTEVRSQTGLRIFLGNSGGIEYRMTFGEGFSYPKRIFSPGQGLYMLAGQTEQPEMIETPRLDKSQLPATLKRALETQYDKNPYPPAPLRSQSKAEA